MASSCSDGNDCPACDDIGDGKKLAAPFGAKVLVRRREYGGSAEPGKPDDLAPRWLEGRYLGLSETVRRGHVVFLSNEDGEKSSTQSMSGLVLRIHLHLMQALKLIHRDLLVGDFGKNLEEAGMS